MAFLGGSWDEDENDDRPLFGRHWLEDDINHFQIGDCRKKLSREDIWSAIEKLNEADLEWIRKKLYTKQIRKERKAIIETKRKLRGYKK